MKKVVKTNVLVVEDDESDFELVCRALTRNSTLQFGVDNVTTLRETLETLKTAPAKYDVIVLDLCLPDAKGLSVFSAIQEITNLPVVILTGRDDPEFALQALGVGVQDYVIKDEHLSGNLCRIILHSVERWKLQEELRSTHARLMETNLKLANASRVVEMQNAKLMAEIEERKQLESARCELEKQLMSAEGKTELAELSCDVLHNVKNVVNSIAVSANLIRERMDSRTVSSLHRAAALLRENVSSLSDFLTRDPKGRLLPEFICKAIIKLASERDTLRAEVDTLLDKVEHVAEVVREQQLASKTSLVRDSIRINCMVDEAIRSATIDSTVGIIRDFELNNDVAAVTDRHRVVQILVNFINNASQAVCSSDRDDKQITVRTRFGKADSICIEVIDNGVGISREHISSLFQRGFTTKRDGHGFGLHTCRIIAEQLGGSVTAISDGPGKGSTFQLQIPLNQVGETQCRQPITAAS